MTDLIDLGEHGRRLYDRVRGNMESQDTWDDLYEISLRMVCLTIDRIMSAFEHLEREGAVLEGSDGKLQLSPVVGILQDYLEHLKKLAGSVIS